MAVPRAGVRPAVAYVDPGNFATNIQAGAETGHRLVWIVIVPNVAAVVIQTRSAKLGLVSGRSLPEQIRDRARPAVVIAAWLGAGVVAIRDRPELVGTGLDRAGAASVDARRQRRDGSAARPAAAECRSSRRRSRP
jgi:NRAMP (natural resistance-associated macrophage protein)-like metal ion transporter